MRASLPRPPPRPLKKKPHPQKTTNNKNQQAGGNESIALVNAVLGNLIGIFISPAWITALVAGPAAAVGQTAPAAAEAAALHAVVPYRSVLGELGYLVLAPLAAGQLLQYFAPHVVAKVRGKINLPDVSSLCIVLIVWLSFCNTFAAARAGKGTPTTAADAAAAFFLCFALLVAFAVIAAVASRLPVPQGVGGCLGARRRRRSGKEEEAVAAGGGDDAAADKVVANGAATGALVVDNGKPALGSPTLPVSASSGAAAAAIAAAEEGRAASAAPSADAAANGKPDHHPTTRQQCRCSPLPREDSVAVIICGATKTLALGAPLISVMYGRSPDVGLVALPLVMYHAQQCVFGAPALEPLKRWRQGERVFGGGGGQGWLKKRGGGKVRPGGGDGGGNGNAAAAE